MACADNADCDCCCYWLDVVSASVAGQVAGCDGDVEREEARVKVNAHCMVLLDCVLCRHCVDFLVVVAVHEQD